MVLSCGSPTVPADGSIPCSLALAARTRADVLRHGRKWCIGMGLEDVAGQRLVSRPHAADGPVPEHAVAARRDEPAVQRLGRDPACRPDPEAVLEFVDAGDHQHGVGSSRAAEKADAVVRISFARRSSETSATQPLELVHRLLRGSSPPRPWRPSYCAGAAAAQARSPDPWQPVRSPSSPTNTRLLPNVALYGIWRWSSLSSFNVILAL